MSGQVELTNPVDTSVGGMRGHLLRRGIHLSMIGIPYLYFSHGESVAEAIGVSLAQVVAGVVLIALVLEGIRLKIGLTVFGQRDYEANQVSALAWGAVGIGFVLLLVPEEAYAWPLIASLALGDPLMGELRRKDIPDRQVMIYATLLILAIWLVAVVQFGTPIWLAILLAPVCMISEWPRLTYIDDNATMLLIPLALVLLLEPFALMMA
ncbi:MAG TPA: hypothetical protein D7H92_06520 [Candidatus Poseidoniales archaeon]|nr:MAG TPA: hypothetical protein D7H92_06520 [Candidatus Poseidoniales archaeon]|tara:strand:+ start:1588 stop:2214 length:627 start_codon:yes stop_codon:yes gene_type:complete